MSPSSEPAPAARIPPPPAWEVRLDVASVLGRCVVVRVGAAGLPSCAALLHPAEAAFAAGLPAPRAATFVAGRTALRETAARIGAACPDPILPGPRGAPRLPAGLSGSLSHKAVPGGVIAAAIIAPFRGCALGVDVEVDDGRPLDAVAGATLNAGEALAVAAAPAATRTFETLVRFSLKEAIYKAIDPIVGRYVDYQEVAVAPREGGGVAITWMSGAGGAFPETDARWLAIDNMVLTTARARIPQNPRRS